jgi:hypothetical protein
MGWSGSETNFEERDQNGRKGRRQARGGGRDARWRWQGGIGNENLRAGPHIEP